LALLVPLESRDLLESVVLKEFLDWLVILELLAHKEPGGRQAHRAPRVIMDLWDQLAQLDQKGHLEQQENQ